jgi:TPR repeat protein
VSDPVEVTFQQAMDYIASIRAAGLGGSDNLDDWLIVARQYARSKADGQDAEALYQALAKIATDGIASFHAARRELGLSETP